MKVGKSTKKGELFSQTETKNRDTIQNALFKTLLQSEMINYGFDENNVLTFFKADKEEDNLTKKFINDINITNLLHLPIDVLNQAIKKYYFLSFNSENFQSDKFIYFLFKCLHKYGKDASILFSYVNLDEKTINKLINKYSDIFDFEIVKSNIQNTINQCSVMLQKINEKVTNINQTHHYYNLMIEKKEKEKSKDFESKNATKKEKLKSNASDLNLKPKQKCLSTNNNQIQSTKSTQKVSFNPDDKTNEEDVSKIKPKKEIKCEHKEKHHPHETYKEIDTRPSINTKNMFDEESSNFFSNLEQPKKKKFSIEKRSKSAISNGGKYMKTKETKEDKEKITKTKSKDKENDVQSKFDDNTVLKGESKGSNKKEATEMKDELTNKEKKQSSTLESTKLIEMPENIKEIENDLKEEPRKTVLNAKPRTKRFQTEKRPKSTKIEKIKDDKDDEDEKSEIVFRKVKPITKEISEIVLKEKSKSKESDSVTTKSTKKQDDMKHREMVDKSKTKPDEDKSKNYLKDKNEHDHKRKHMIQHEKSSMRATNKFDEDINKEVSKNAKVLEKEVPKIEAEIEEETDSKTIAEPECTKKKAISKKAKMLQQLKKNKKVNRIKQTSDSDEGTTEKIKEHSDDSKQAPKSQNKRPTKKSKDHNTNDTILNETKEPKPIQKEETLDGTKDESELVITKDVAKKPINNVNEKETDEVSNLKPECSKKKPLTKKEKLFLRITKKTKVKTNKQTSDSDEETTEEKKEHSDDSKHIPKNKNKRTTERTKRHNKNNTIENETKERKTIEEAKVMSEEFDMDSDDTIEETKKQAKKISKESSTSNKVDNKETDEEPDVNPKRTKKKPLTKKEKVFKRITKKTKAKINKQTSDSDEETKEHSKKEKSKSKFSEQNSRINKGNTNDHKKTNSNKTDAELDYIQAFIRRKETNSFMENNRNCICKIHGLSLSEDTYNSDYI